MSHQIIISFAEHYYYSKIYIITGQKLVLTSLKLIRKTK